MKRTSWVLVGLAVVGVALFAYQEEVTITLNAQEMYAVAKQAYACGLVDGAARAAAGTARAARLKRLKDEEEETCRPVRLLLGLNPEVAVEQKQ